MYDSEFVSVDFLYGDGCGVSAFYAFLELAHYGFLFSGSEEKSGS